MSNSVIIHKYFQDCQNYVLDPYWKDILFQCACNKFPRCIRYDPNTKTLFVKTSISGGRLRSENIILPDDPERAYSTIINIFREKLGIFSSTDIKLKQVEIEEYQQQKKIDLDCEWKKIKPRCIKDRLIIDYVIRLMEEYNLTSKEANLLLAKIHLSFFDKKLISDDIIFQSRRIQSINGLVFNPKKRRWNVINEPREVVKVEKNVPVQKFYQSIDKFIRDYKSLKNKIHVE